MSGLSSPHTWDVFSIADCTIWNGMTALKCGTVSLVSNWFDYFDAVELLFCTTTNSSKPMPLYVLDALDSGCIFWDLTTKRAKCVMCVKYWVNGHRFPLPTPLAEEKRVDDSWHMENHWQQAQPKEEARWCQVIKTTWELSATEQWGRPTD